MRPDAEPPRGPGSRGGPLTTIRRHHGSAADDRTYLQPIRTEMTRMLEQTATTPLEERFLNRAFWRADPGTGRLNGSIAEWSEWLDVGYRQMRECVDALADRGVIRKHLPRGHAGWIEIVGYHRMLAPSEWLASQRVDVRDDGPVVATSPRDVMDGSQRPPGKLRRGKTPRGSNDLRAVDQSTGRVVDPNTGEIVERFA